MEKLLLEAQDPNTTPERLVELSRQYSPAIKKAVAQNPNTPLSTLLLLAEKQPRAVLENPTLPLLLLENPNLLHGLEHRAAVVMLQARPLPDWVARTIATHPDLGIRHDISGDEETPKVALETLALDSDRMVREFVAGNENTPAAALRLLSTDVEVEVRRNVAGNPSTPVVALIWLAKNKDKEVRRNVESNGTTPYHLQVKLSKQL
jgi:hypothetical protein